MAFIIVLTLIIVLILFYRDEIKKYPKSLYTLLTIIGFLSIIFQGNFITNSINTGYPSLALFVVVMFIGAFDRKNKKALKFYAIRGQLSISAFILLVPHGMIRLIQYFNQIFSSWGIVIGLISFLVMIPLFITSFISIRKKINNKKWKSLHKWSYIAYFTTFLHLYLLSNYTHQIIYTITFLVYTLLKLNKLYYHKNLIAKYAIYISMIVIAIVLNVTPSKATSNINLSTSQYQDGTYTGTGIGYRNLPVEVKVTLSNNKIVSIQIVDCGCTGNPFASIVSSNANKIVSQQSLNIDAVSGASHSTDGLKQAVEDALSKAKK